MVFIEWKEIYETGVEEVDFEHRELVDLLNSVFAQLVTTGSETSVSEFLGEVYSKISSHFALEEKNMRDAGFAEYGAHKNDHEALLDALRDLMEEYEHGLAADHYEAFSIRLDRWFTSHFGTFDARLHGA